MSPPALPLDNLGDRRDQILTAAAELFARHGFHGVGIDDIGAAVGISGPALYRHFRGKEAMLGEMLTSISGYLLEGGTHQVGLDDDPHAVLAGLVRFHVTFALTRPALITVQERSLGNLAEPDRKRVRSLQRQYVELWVQALRDVVPELDEPRARSTAHAVFGLMNSTPHSRHLPDEELLPLLEHLALGALYAARPQP